MASPPIWRPAPAALDQARREDVEAWIGVLLGRWKPASAHNRYRGLHAFYRWLEEEDDLPIRV